MIFWLCRSMKNAHSDSVQYGCSNFAASSQTVDKPELAGYGTSKATHITPASLLDVENRWHDV